MKEYGNGANRLIQAMLTKAIEEVSPDSCASGRVGMASEIGEVFLDPLLDQNGTERTSKAEYQAECPQNIHGDVQVAGTSRPDIRNGG